MKPLPIASGRVNSTDIQAELTILLYRQAPIVLGGVLIAASFSAFILWPLVARPPLLIWLVLVYLVTLVRLALVWRFHARSDVLSASHRWSRLFAFSSLVSGVLWGTMGILFFVPEQPLTFIFVTFMLVGMTAGSVAALSAYWPAYYGFAITTIVPFSVRCALESDPMFTTMSVLSLLYLAVNLLYSRNIYHALRESVRLRFANQDLLQQLNEEKALVEAASQSKTQFLATASHDLRQPAHALGLYVGVLETLVRDPVSNREALTKVTEKFKRSLNGLGNLLNKLLDISRLDAGDVKAVFTSTRIQDLLDDLSEEFATLASAKGLRLVVIRSTLYARTDAILLRQVLVNLVANAVRYSQSGRVVVGCRRRNGGRDIEIQVWDSGIGIPHTELETIFGEFQQLHNPARDREQGMGLGLAIVRRTAQVLSHEIKVRSMVAKGSMFSVSMPRAEADLTLPNAVNPPGPVPHDLFVLVIDDNTEVLDAISVLISSWGFGVIGVTSASQLRQAIGNNKDRIQLILADYQLGCGMNGVDAIRYFREQLGRDVAAAIVTGDTSPKGIQAAAASGFTVLYKPLKVADIRMLLTG